MPHWQTTICGLIAAMGAYLSSITDPTWIHYVGTTLQFLGTAGLGFFAASASSVVTVVKPGTTVATPGLVVTPTVAQ